MWLQKCATRSFLSRSSTMLQHIGNVMLLLLQPMRYAPCTLCRMT